MNPAIANGIAGVVLFAVVAVWVSVLGRLRLGQPVVAFSPRRSPPWGVIAVIFSFLLLITGQVGVALAFGTQEGEDPTVSQSIALLAALAITISAITLVSAFVIRILHSASLYDLGFSLEHVGRDILIGVGAFLILGPIAYAIQALFVFQFGMESHHPLIELVKEDKTNELFAMVGVLAVLVAPMSEEFFFRVLLQGWIEKHLLFVGFGRKPGIIDETSGNESAVTDQRVSTGSMSDGEPQHDPYRAFTPNDGLDEQVLAADLELVAAPPDFILSAIPIFCSATFFALMHWSHGPDPAALFVLALGLGYVYQRTHRWLPCVVTHLCLNGTTMLMLWASMNQPP